MLLKQIKTGLLISTAVALLSSAVFAADPLAAKTMVVYVSNSPDSVAVKDYYMAARSIPNSCPITLPDTTAGRVSLPDYVTYIRTPVRSCLTAAGAGNILYIVLAYVRPFAIDTSLYSYAVDSYLGDIWDQYSTQNFYPAPTATHRYYAANQSQGNFYQPFQSLLAYRSAPRSNLIYSVWRLDGPTKEIANGLVDKATAAMNNLTGAVCIDRNRPLYGIVDFGYGQGDWDLHRAATLFGQTGFAVTEDEEQSEFGTSPAPAKCPADGSPVAFFSGWYSLNNYNGPGVFNFAPGAIGIHLDSLAAADPRSGSNWSANAIQNGITVTAGAMAEPYLEGIPRPGGISRNLLEGANVGDAFLRNTRWLKWVILNIGDPLYRPFPASGFPSFNALGNQASLYMAATELLGGVNTSGTVNLAAVAPAGGVTVSLSSSNPAAASVPATIVVPANAKSATFPITTAPVQDTAYPVITASFGATALQNVLAVDPVLGAITLSSNTASAGVSLTGTVLLNAGAPVGGAVITLASTDTSSVNVPLTVSIPAGIGRATFPITTSPVTAAKTVKIQGSYAGHTVEATLSVVPAIASVAFNQATVTAGGFDVFYVLLASPAPAGGAVVTLTNSNPAAAPLPGNQIVVPAGQIYGQISFNAGTGPASATIAASYGGDSKSATVNVN